DLWGTRRLFLLGLALFSLGSLLAGAAPTLDLLIAARLVQGLGGGILVPVGTAAASHLFDGHDRPRALGIIGALTFLGMAAGPFLGAAILGGFDVAGGLARLGVGDHTPLHDALVPSWRWVFYINVPIGLIALFVACAAPIRSWTRACSDGRPSHPPRSFPSSRALPSRRRSSVARSSSTASSTAARTTSGSRWAPSPRPRRSGRSSRASPSGSCR